MLQVKLQKMLKMVREICLQVWEKGRFIYDGDAV